MRISIRQVEGYFLSRFLAIIAQTLLAKTANYEKAPMMLSGDSAVMGNIYSFPYARKSISIVVFCIAVWLTQNSSTNYVSWF